MSKINLLGAFFLRAVFLSGGTTPAFDGLSNAPKKIPDGFVRFFDVSQSWLMGRKRSSDHGLIVKGVICMPCRKAKGEYDKACLLCSCFFVQNNTPSDISIPDFLFPILAL